MAEAILLAVNGTLMRGLELNGNMLNAGARFVREARTSAQYRLYTIGDVHPAMLRVTAGGAAIALELWELPPQAVAAILLAEPAGLSIGKVVLDDGAEVLGVLGEPWLCDQGTDITSHGGWRNYLAATGRPAGPPQPSR
jgi:hypothetical protein